MDLTQPTRINRFGALIGLICILMVTAITGCSKENRNILFNTPKQYEKMGLAVVHLNGDSTKSTEEYQHRIGPDDRIALRFLNNFDISAGVTITKQGSAESGVSFLVDKGGMVSLPMLGRVEVKGLTKQEAQVKLEELYSANFKNPSVEVSILGLSVAVQGEVRSPGVYQLQREKTTVLEMIATAGGITQYGKKKVVKVVRGIAQGVEPEIYIFDLRQLDAIETSELILRDKDIIYVEPRDIRVFAEALSPYSSFLTLLSTVTTITVVAINIVGR
ncbi:MAG TPA: hypothetical protein ENJ82_12845 [Bacteroidetes bacterium]|nr:hypothetical protein [Bacteroidota bacterium]